MSKSESKSAVVRSTKWGCVVAMLLSAILNQSFWWGLFHFFCGWLYVLYALCTRAAEIIPAFKLLFGL